MATSLAKQCGVCAEDYDEEERCPRRLPCLHTFCTRCISQLLSIGNSRCPFCQGLLDAQAADDFEVNADTLDQVKYTREHEKKSSSEVVPPLTPSEARRLEELKRKLTQKAINTINSYKVADAEISAQIQKNNEMKENLLRAKTILQEEIMTKMNELLESNLKIVDFLDQEQKVMRDQLVVVQDQKRKYERGESTEEDVHVLNGCLASIRGLVSCDEGLRERLTGILRSRQSLVAKVERILRSASEEDDDMDPEEMDRNVMKIIEEIQGELGRGQ